MQMLNTSRCPGARRAVLRPVPGVARPRRRRSACFPQKKRSRRSRQARGYCSSYSATRYFHGEWSWPAISPDSLPPKDQSTARTNDCVPVLRPICPGRREARACRNAPDRS